MSEWIRLPRSRSNLLWRSPHWILVLSSQRGSPSISHIFITAFYCPWHCIFLITWNVSVVPPFEPGYRFVIHRGYSNLENNCIETGCVPPQYIAPDSLWNMQANPCLSPVTTNARLPNSLRWTELPVHQNPVVSHASGTAGTNMYSCKCRPQKIYFSTLMNQQMNYDTGNIFSWIYCWFQRLFEHILRISQTFRSFELQ